MLRSQPRVDIVNFELLDGAGEPTLSGAPEDYAVGLARIIRSLGGRPRVVQLAAAAFSSVHHGIDVIGLTGSGSMGVEAVSEYLADTVRDASVAIVSPVELACRLPSTLSVIGISHGVDWSAQSHRTDSDDSARIRLLAEALGVC